MDNSTKIMVCDDDRSIGDVLKMILETTGADVEVECYSPNLYRRMVGFHPTILIIDLWMPEMPGDHIIKQLRSEAEFRDLYIVCVSASLDGAKVSKDAGADFFLPKPFDMDSLLQVVNQVPAA